MLFIMLHIRVSKIFSFITTGLAHIPIVGYAGVLSKKANQNITDLRNISGYMVGFKVALLEIVPSFFKSKLFTEGMCRKILQLHAFQHIIFSGSSF